MLRASFRRHFAVLGVMAMSSGNRVGLGWRGGPVLLLTRTVNPVVVGLFAGSTREWRVPASTCVWCLCVPLYVLHVEVRGRLALPSVCVSSRAPRGLLCALSPDPPAALHLGIGVPRSAGARHAASPADASDRQQAPGHAAAPDKSVVRVAPLRGPHHGRRALHVGVQPNRRSREGTARCGERFSTRSARKQRETRPAVAWGREHGFGVATDGTEVVPRKVSFLAVFAAICNHSLTRSLPLPFLV